MNGLIVLDKPAGITSAAAVNRVKRLLPRGTKIGHAGTLDPFATGVLLLLVGKATKSCERLMDHAKQYDATIKFGASTATDDLESPEIPCAGAMEPAREQLLAALERFRGIVPQRPPAFSALKVSGRPAYKLARAGNPANLEPRNVRIDDIEIQSWQWPLLKVRIDCGRGTYIRAIARDLGEMLNVGGFLIELRRTRSGPYRIEHAVSLETLDRDGTEKHLLALDLPDGGHAEQPQQRRQDDQHQG
jgi:tRNA pseudouridine55 synthase